MAKKLSKLPQVARHESRHWLGEPGNNDFVAISAVAWPGDDSTVEVAIHTWQTVELAFNTIEQLDKLIKPLLEARKWLEIHGSKAPKK